MAVEIPAWAWGLIVTVLAGGFGIIVALIAYFAARVDKRLDGHDQQFAEQSKRTGKIENRVTALEAREAA